MIHDYNDKRVLELCGVFPVADEVHLPGWGGVVAGIHWRPLDQDGSLLPSVKDSPRLLLADWAQVPVAVQARHSSSGIVGVIGLGKRPADRLLIDLLAIGMNGYIVVPLSDRDMGLALRDMVRAYG